MVGSDNFGDLTQAIVEWLKGERTPQPRWQVQSDLERLGRTTSLWPTATADQWERAIIAVLKQGLITELNGKLRIAVEKQEPEEKQLGLF